MKRLLVLAVLALAGCGGCASDPWLVPVDPVPPAPVPPAAVAAWEAVTLVVEGMTVEAAKAVLAVTAAFDTDQEDGTRIASYPSVGPAGEPEYLVVRSRAGVVTGRSRIPRAVPPPSPIAAVGGSCVGDECAMPGCVR